MSITWNVELSFWLEALISFSGIPIAMVFMNYAFLLFPKPNDLKGGEWIEDAQIAELFKLYQGYDGDVETISDVLIDGSIIKEFGKLKAKCKFCWHYGTDGCTGYFGLNGDVGVLVNPDDSCINFRNDFMRKIVERLDEMVENKIRELPDGV